ncbi:hypothetical protein NWF32_18785 [Pseudomonas qingdaonensis]|nr:hypothetical protein [Pseudomonas qingdaonensis]
MLNFEGLINGKSMEAAPTDLLFYYGPALAEKRGHANPDLLGLPVLDIDLFKAPPAGTPRRGCYLYQNRHPLEQIDYSLLPEGIQLLRIANALPLHELGPGAALGRGDVQLRMVDDLRDCRAVWLPCDLHAR